MFAEESLRCLNPLKRLKPEIQTKKKHLLRPKTAPKPLEKPNVVADLWIKVGFFPPKSRFGRWVFVNESKICKTQQKWEQRKPQMTQKRLEKNYLYEKHFNQNYKKRDFGGRFLGEAKIVEKKKTVFNGKCYVKWIKRTAPTQNTSKEKPVINRKLPSKRERAWHWRWHPVQKSTKITDLLRMERHERGSL